jgi:hypothetical protein
MRGVDILGAGYKSGLSTKRQNTALMGQLDRPTYHIIINGGAAC